MYEKSAFARFCQGDILAEVKYAEIIKEAGSELTIENIILQLIYKYYTLKNQITSILPR